MGQKPRMDKYIIISGPHTSNWDFLYMYLFIWYYGLQLTWIGKHTLFRKPFGWLLRWLGGMPVKRCSRNNVIDQLTQMFAEHDQMVLVMQPEGTRSYVDYWKSGFYILARNAGVPIALGFLDYEHKEGGIGPLLYPSDDIQEDMDKVREFYEGKSAKYVEMMAPIRLKIEAKTTPKREL